MNAEITARRSTFLIPYCGLLAAFMMAAPSDANAQSAGAERFSLSFGVFLTDRDTNTTLNGSSGDSGTDVDLEQDLGLSCSDSVFRIDGYHSFNEKHRIDFSWFDLSRTSSKQIQRDIEWNGTLYPIDTAVNSQFDLGIYKVAYTWSFDRKELGRRSDRPLRWSRLSVLRQDRLRCGIQFCHVRPRRWQGEFHRQRRLGV